MRRRDYDQQEESEIDEYQNLEEGGQSQGQDLIFLQEQVDPNYQPTQDEVLEYANFLGMDLQRDEKYFYIAREGLIAPLPAQWKACQNRDEEIFYLNIQTNQIMETHPCDDYFRTVYLEEQQKDMLMLHHQQNKLGSNLNKPLKGQQQKIPPGAQSNPQLLQPLNKNLKLNDILARPPLSNNNIGGNNLREQQETNLPRSMNPNNNNNNNDNRLYGQNPNFPDSQTGGGGGGGGMFGKNNSRDLTSHGNTSNPTTQYDPSFSQSKISGAHFQKSNQSQYFETNTGPDQSHKMISNNSSLIQIYDDMHSKNNLKGGGSSKKQENQLENNSSIAMFQEERRQINEEWETQIQKYAEKSKNQFEKEFREKQQRFALEERELDRDNEDMLDFMRSDYDEQKRIAEDQSSTRNSLLREKIIKDNHQVIHIQIEAFKSSQQRILDDLESQEQKKLQNALKAYEEDLEAQVKAREDQFQRNKTNYENSITQHQLQSEKRVEMVQQRFQLSQTQIEKETRLKFEKQLKELQKFYLHEKEKYSMGLDDEIDNIKKRIAEKKQKEATDVISRQLDIKEIFEKKLELQRAEKSKGIQEKLKEIENQEKRDLEEIWKRAQEQQYQHEIQDKYTQIDNEKDQVFSQQNQELEDFVRSIEDSYTHKMRVLDVEQSQRINKLQEEISVKEYIQSSQMHNGAQEIDNKEVQIEQIKSNISLKRKELYMISTDQRNIQRDLLRVKTEFELMKHPTGDFNRTYYLENEIKNQIEILNLLQNRKMGNTQSQQQFNHPLNQSPPKGLFKDRIQEVDDSFASNFNSMDVDQKYDGTQNNNNYQNDFLAPGKMKLDNYGYQEWCTLIRRQRTEFDNLKQEFKTDQIILKQTFQYLNHEQQKMEREIGYIDQTQRQEAVQYQKIDKIKKSQTRIIERFNQDVNLMRQNEENLKNRERALGKLENILQNKSNFPKKVFAQQYEFYLDMKSPYLNPLFQEHENDINLLNSSKPFDGNDPSESFRNFQSKELNYQHSRDQHQPREFSEDHQIRNVQVNNFIFQREFNKIFEEQEQVRGVFENQKLWLQNVKEELNQNLYRRNHSTSLYSNSNSTKRPTGFTSNVNTSFYQ